MISDLTQQMRQQGLYGLAAEVESATADALATQAQSAAALSSLETSLGLTPGSVSLSNLVDTVESAIAKAAFVPPTTTTQAPAPTTTQAPAPTGAGTGS